MPHRHHIYTTVYEMAMATMCTYPPSQHVLKQWKCVLRCCYICPHIDLPYQESYMHHSNASISISFHISHLIAWCTVHRRRRLEKEKILCLYFKDLYNVTPVKLYPMKSGCHYGEIYF